MGFATRREFFGKYLSQEYLLRRQKQTGNLIPILHICSDLERLPWNLFFDKSPDMLPEHTGPENSKLFWGLDRVIVQRPLIYEEITEDVPTQHNQNHKQEEYLRIGVVIEKNLKYAKKEYGNIKRLIKELGIPAQVELFRPRQNYDQRSLITDMNAFLSQDFDIIHLACHAHPHPIKKLARQSAFIICDADEYLLRYLTQYDTVANITAPLVFMNACDTGIRDASQTYNFVGALQSRGAQNVVAIEAAIQSQIAENLATLFYRYFLQGMPLGLALYNAKNDIIDKGKVSEDIYAVFYSLYGDENHKILL